MALPRGGIVVADEIANELNLALDVLISKKINPPGNEEFAIGAIAEGGGELFNEDLLQVLDLTDEDLSHEINEKKKEISRRAKVYRGKRKNWDLQNKRIILVDDGVATGSTLLAAIKSLRMSKVKRIITAVPVAAPEALAKIKNASDETFCLYTPNTFVAVGAFYEEFRQTEDEEVIGIMNKYK